MKTIATLSPSVRLVVFQFLMKSAQVPAIVPPKRASETPPLPPVSGVEILASTPKLSIFPMANSVACCSDYELMDVWKKSHESKWDMSFVRFVFCHKEHVNCDEIYLNFVAKRAGMGATFFNLVSDNLWATMGHLNPYLGKDGTPTGHQVLMLGSAGRVENTEVFSGGRDENNRGVGPKVLLSRLSSRLELIGNFVVLGAPEPMPAVSASAI